MEERKEIENQPLEDLQALLRQLTDEKSNKIDYIVDADQLRTIYDIGTKTYKLELIQPSQNDIPTAPLQFEINEVCHTQIAQKTQIPKPFYDRLREKYPELLLQNINQLKDGMKKVTLRTLYGRARALLSNRYQSIDNADVMNCALKNLNEISKAQGINIKIMQSRNTDTHFYLKVYSPEYTAQIGNDTVHGGVVISNSEVGMGRFTVQLFIAIVRCNNGMISEKGVSRVHLGTAKEDQTIAWSDRTLELDDATLFSKLEDLIHTAFNKTKFDTWINELNNVAQTPITKPIVAIRNVQKDYGISQDEADNLLTKFSEYGFTQWGLAQTVTDYAQSKPNYNDQIALEKAGADIMTKKIEVLVREDESK